MRVTGGTYCGRKLTCPPGVIRPAMDRMRESMFSILGDLGGLSFLDCFAGSGIVGVEAAGRGASPVVFVEKDRKKIPVLKRNISFVEESTTVLCMDVVRYLKTTGDTFDVVHLDPPFAMKDKVKLLGMVEEQDILKAEGIMMLHHPKGEEYPETLGSLILKRTKTYGGSILRFYVKSL